MKKGEENKSGRNGNEKESKEKLGVEWHCAVLCYFRFLESQQNRFARYKPVVPYQFLRGEFCSHIFQFLCVHHLMYIFCSPIRGHIVMASGACGRSCADQV